MTGDVHGSNGSRSSEHSNVASATLDSKWIVASELWTSPPVAGSPSVPGVKPGPAVNVVTTPSSRHVYIAGWPTLPSKSIARTKKMCGPTSVSSRPHSKPPWFMWATVSKPQFSHALRSTLHSNVTSGSFEWNVKIESSAQVSGSGFMSMNACGATPAGSGRYSHVCFAGVSSASSPMSTVRISSVCMPGLRFVTSCGYSQSSHAWSLVVSRRHSKTRSTSGVESSLPMYVKLALRLLLTSGGFSTNHVSGVPGAVPRTHTTPTHWPGSMLPAAKLPPPSIAPAGA